MTVKLLKLLSIFLLLGVFLCCGKQPTQPKDNRPWPILTDKCPTWSPDGNKIAYVCGGNPNQGGSMPAGLYIVEVGTRERVLILESGGHLSGLDWSSDGEWIVFSWYGKICRITPDGDSLVQLTTGGEEFAPRWFSDGQQIVFHRPVVPGGVFLTNSEGQSEVHLLNEAIHPDWFPDGKNLALIVWDSTQNAQIAMFSMADSTVEILMNEPTVGEKYIRVSPDGAQIMYTAAIPGTPPCLYTVDVRTREVQRLSMDAGYSGCWSPDGQYIAYNYPYDGSIYIRDLHADTTTRITPGALIFEPEWDSLGFPRKGEYVW
jgi:Tol biopolymer transport system component